MCNTKTFKEFVDLVSKLEPVEYCAICKILGVEMVNGEEIRKFDETLEEVLDGFLNMKRKPRRQLMKMLKQSQR